MSKTIELMVKLSIGNDNRPEQLDTLTRHLLRELKGTKKFEAVKLAGSEDVEQGGKDIDPIAIGAMVVLISPLAQQAIAALGTVLSAWIERDSNRSITLQCGENSLVVTNISSQKQEELIEQWFQKCQDDQIITP